MARIHDTKQLAFEDALQNDWDHDLDVIEVPLGNRSLFYLGIAVFVAVLAVAGRMFYFNAYQSALFAKKAAVNLGQSEKIAAPRGLIYDRNGKVLAENRVAFAAILEPKTFLQYPGVQSQTLDALENILSLPRDYVWSLVEESSKEDFATPVVLSEDLGQAALVQLRGLNLPTIRIESDFQRRYPEGPAFSSVLGYIGRVTDADLKGNKDLGNDDFIGKAGVEAFYDSALRGRPGSTVKLKNAQGKVLQAQEKQNPEIGSSVHLTIDGDFQSYFYDRLQQGLWALGRRVGVGIALDPRNGEVLALVNLPGYDNNLFTTSGHRDEKNALFASEDKPMFDRAVSGFYSPGSTIKPLVGVAALKEGVIDPKREIFSPGYLDVPNPYDKTISSRYLDWRYQGNVDLAAAIAQSSDVYFYLVGGGSPAASTPLLNDPSDYGIKGLGVSRLHDWWEKFGLGKPTGIDMPNEAAGFLPTPDWKVGKFGTPWLLGDTYNISIGQGDLLLTPIQILNFTAAIGNGGKIYVPVVNKDLPHPQILADLTAAGPEIADVEQGMQEAVTSPGGTAHLLADLGFSAGAKTGSAQVKNNQQENALFVGYVPAKNPQIAILILIENSREGSLNAVPVAKDVLNWYYWNRIKK